MFYNVIEWFVDTPLFSSARAHQVGRSLWYLLAIATLGLVWLPALVRHLRQRRAQRGGQKEKETPWPADHGNGKNGASNGQAAPAREPVEPRI